eukprot:1218774-Alexandrium_andersonii.AAC.1
MNCCPDCLQPGFGSLGSEDWTERHGHEGSPAAAWPKTEARAKGQLGLETPFCAIARVASPVWPS